MTRYRIVKNGYDQYFVEKMVNDSKWIKCPFKQTRAAIVCEPGVLFNNPLAPYNTYNEAKRALEALKEEHKLSKEIVVYVDD